MNKITSVLCVLVATIATLNGFTNARLTNLGDFVSIDKTYHQTVRDALLKLEGIDTQYSYTVREGLEKAHGDRPSQRVYDALLELNQDEIKECSMDMIKCSSSVIMQDELIEFRKFIINRGFVIEQCAMQEMKNILEYEYTKEKYTPINKVFKAALNFPVDAKTRAFTVRLDGINMANQKLKVHSMVREIEKLNRIEKFFSSRKIGSVSPNGRKLEMLEKFFDKMCTIFTPELQRRFAVINLATAINRHQMHRPEFRQLNQYNRICLSWRNPEMRPSIMNNMRLGLESKGTYEEEEQEEEEGYSSGSDSETGEE